MEQTIYQELGYKSRRDYLNSLANEYGLSRDTVYFFAMFHGKSEDFDGLVNACRDAEEMGMEVE